MERSNVPPGAYVELTLDLIDDGRAVEQIHEKVREAVKKLVQYEQDTGDMKAKASVTLKLVIQRTKNSLEFFDVEYATEAKYPTRKGGCSVRAGKDRLLCQPGGADADNPDQLEFFDRNGNIIGGPKEDGDHPAVAGRIAATQ